MAGSLREMLWPILYCASHASSASEYATGLRTYLSIHAVTLNHGSVATATQPCVRTDYNLRLPGGTNRVRGPPAPSLNPDFRMPTMVDWWSSIRKSTVVVIDIVHENSFV